MGWTQFWDMHSGGSQKLEWAKIYIEAPAEEAKIIFYNRFGRNPERVTCTCCGEDYSISEHEDLAQLTGFHRNCRTLETPRDSKGRYLNDDPVIKKMLYLEDGERPPKGYAVSERGRYGKYMTLKEYAKRPDVLMVRDKEIKKSERTGKVPVEGYVWA